MVTPFEVQTLRIVRLALNVARERLASRLGIPDSHLFQMENLQRKVGSVMFQRWGYQLARFEREAGPGALTR